MPFDGTGYSDAKQVLIRARELLETEGWVQDKMRSPDGRCAMGAIYDVAITQSAEEPLRRLACAMGFTDIQGIVPWNDTHTRFEVLQAFDRAIGGLP